MNHIGLHDIIREDFECTPHPDFEKLWERVMDEIGEDQESK